jgi:hypothetical protein
MKGQAAWAGAVASAVVSFVASSLVAFSLMAPTAASAEVRIANDPGGEVSSYIRKFEQVRDSGDRVVIDGPCLSACTLLTGIVPRDHVCVTSRAVLGFHAASYYDDASRSLVPTRQGSALVMRLYPAQIRAWIGRHGGLTPSLIEMHGRELTSLYRTCQ